MHKTSLTLYLAVLLAVTTHAADRPDIQIKDVDMSEVVTPAYHDENGNDTIQVYTMTLDSTTRRKWFRISTEFETRPEWIGQLVFEYYVFMPTPDDKELMFKGVVPYINIPERRDHISEMYMHFDAYKRFYDRGKINYAVLIKKDGEVVAMESSNEKPAEWWVQRPVHPYTLRTRLQTPFRVINVEKRLDIDLNH